MGFNKYKWYSKGKPKTLPESRPLLLRIRNGDFDTSYYLKEVDRVKQEYADKYMKEWNLHDGVNDKERHQYAHESARMRNVAKLKLEKDGMWDELKILDKLREGLTDEFGVDLWDEAHQEQRGDGSIEDLYWWYKERLGIGQTPSEIAIKLKRKTTKGLK